MLVNVNVGAQAEHVVAELEQAVHFASQLEHLLPSRKVPVAQPQVDPERVNPPAHAEQCVEGPEHAVHFGSHGKH